MTDRPILFSGSMVRAILAGRKTQTRRLVTHNSKVQPSTAELLTEWCKADPRTRVYVSERGGLCAETHGGTAYTGAVCPYGVAGDRLWVRETHRVVGWNDVERATVEYQADGTKLSHDVVVPDYDAWVEKRCAALERQGATQHWKKGEEYASLRLPEGVEQEWTPSISLQRWASRITLPVALVRVERLQDITEDDARAEGLAKLTKDGGVTYKHGIADRDGLPGNDDDGWHWCEWEVDPRKAFAKLWDSINSERAPWASNPWVWVVSWKEAEVRRAA